jgi:hypothetical protein
MRINNIRIGNWVRKNDLIIQAETEDDLDLLPVKIGIDGLLQMDMQILWGSDCSNGCFVVELPGPLLYDQENELPVFVYYRHEVQNLYFALTGRELDEQIKRPTL